MEVTMKNKWMVRAAALVIFLLGFIAGSLSMNLYNAGAGTNFNSRGHHLQEVIGQLNLNSEQKAKVDKIVSETREQFRAVRKESEPKVQEVRNQARERLKTVLTPEQWQRFEQLMKNSHDEHRHSDDEKN